MAIRTNIKDINRAILGVIRALKSEEKRLIRNAAGDFKILVQTNINSQKFANPSWRYSPAYSDFKRVNAPGQPFWKFSGDLFRSISVIRRNNTSLFVGIPPGAVSSDGENIGQYALEMEFGNNLNNQPPRPVFTPTLHEYFSGGFQRRVDQTITAIISRWRA